MSTRYVIWRDTFDRSKDGLLPKHYAYAKSFGNPIAFSDSNAKHDLEPDLYGKRFSHY